jgi:toxin CptA
LSQSLLFAGPLLVLAGWRALQTLHAARRRDFLDYLWSPHVATAVIGVTFVTLLLLAGPWNYTDYLAEAARHMAGKGASRGVLLFALFAGATIGGWSAGRIRLVKPAAFALARCLTGGILLGLGGSLVPGANDGLILLGLPLFYPHAWLAFASMLVAIAAALVLQRARTMARGAGLA